MKRVDVLKLSCTHSSHPQPSPPAKEGHSRTPPTATGRSRVLDLPFLSISIDFLPIETNKDFSNAIRSGSKLLSNNERVVDSHEADKNVPRGSLFVMANSRDSAHFVRL